MRKVIKANHTDEYIVAKAKEFLAKNPNCSRAALRTVCETSYERLERLAQDGSFKMPVKCPKGKAHVFKKDDTWRKFRLWGSPTTPKKVSDYDKTR